MRWFIERCTPEQDVEHIRRWGHHILMRADERAAERLMEVSYQGRPDIAEHLSKIRVPTLLIHGQLDLRVSLEEMRYLSSLIPNSRLVVFPGTGHLPIMIQPAKVASTINDHFMK
jgi:hypothetical protein